MNIVAHKEFKGVGYLCTFVSESEKQFSETKPTSFENTGGIHFQIQDSLELFEINEVPTSSFPKKLCILYFGGSIENILSDAGVDSTRWIIR